MKLLSHLLCLFIGGAVVGVVALPHRAMPETAPRAARPEPPDPRLDEIAERIDNLAPVLGRLEVLAARLDRAEQAVVEARGAEHKVMVIDPPPTVPPQQRMAALALSKDPDRVAEALDAWRAIEQSSADPRRRAEACFEQGQIHVKLEDWDAAAEAFRKVVDQIGLGSGRGQTAAYQLGCCESRRGDKRAAYECFRRLCDAPNLVDSAAPTYRYQMAGFALAAGDVETARREFERYVADYENDRAEHVRNFVKFAREKLAQLR